METPFFLSVVSVSTSFTFEGSALAAAELNADPSTATLGVAGRAVSSPTVAYTPLQGDQFAERLLSPFELSMVLLLTNSGWSIERRFVARPTPPPTPPHHLRPRNGISM